MKRNLRILTLAAGASIAAAMVCAPVAAASTETFLDELHTNNVWLPNKTPGEVIGAGYATCGHLRGGTSVLDEMSAVEQTYQFNQGTLFVSAATTNLCPDFAG
jgi:Protein of unknown function (DUF732)